jgi:Bacterial PH domain
VGLLSPSRDRNDPAADRQHRKEHGVWSRLLGAGEAVLEVFRLTRCTFVFTNRRLVLVDEAVSGRHVEYTSLPYRSITHTSIEASGPFSPEADLRLWVVGRSTPLERQFGPEVDVYAVQALLVQYQAGS